MKKEEIEYLRELKKRDLTILTFQPYGHRFVVHKNTQNKISHDIVGKGKKLTEFLDHIQDEPGNVHLYVDNFHANKQIFIPEEFRKLADTEREEMDQYAEKAEFPENKD